VLLGPAAVDVVPAYGTVGLRQGQALGSQEPRLFGRRPSTASTCAGRVR
jgi:hypothetical protein